MNIWTIHKTERGFEQVVFRDHNNGYCTLQQSSGIDPTLPDSFDRPGSSFVWLGRDAERMHLSREQVTLLVLHLSSWLEYGSFNPDGKVVDPLELLDQAQARQRELEQEVADLKQQLKEEREIAERAVIEAMQDGANDAYAEGRRDEREKHETWERY